MSPNPEHLPQAWDAVADAYDRVAPQLMRPYAEDALRLLRPKASDRVLDVATGPGTFAFLAARAAAEVVATDFSPAMIDRLRARAAADGVANVKGAVMDAHALELEPATFDHAAMLFGILHVGDPRRALGELARVVRPGGRAVVSTWCGPEAMGALRLLGDALVHAIPGMPAPPVPELALTDPRVFADLLREAGFEDVAVHPAKHTWSFASAQAFWDALGQSAPPLRALFGHLGPEKAEAIGRAAVARIREVAGEGPVRVENSAHIAIAARAS